MSKSSNAETPGFMWSVSDRPSIRPSDLHVKADDDPNLSLNVFGKLT